MIYGLPFHTQRFFRPTMLEAFDITNTQLGDMFAVYGLTAMFSYFFGGPFADRYAARSLIAVSLMMTAAWAQISGLRITSGTPTNGLRCGVTVPWSCGIRNHTRTAHSSVMTE